MPLDIPTLEHQLAVYTNNLASLDVTIKSTTEQIQQLSLSLERLYGAREYHGLLVGQVRQAIDESVRLQKAAMLAAEAVALPASPPSSASVKVDEVASGGVEENR